jgi:hypothetical protein
VTVHKGSCLCGAIRFEAEGELHPPDACHCTQCRKQSGHVWASTNVPKDKLRLHGADKISWYQSSEMVRRGFCSVAAPCCSGSRRAILDRHCHGRIRDADGTQLAKHIFVAEQGDYYRIADGLPQSDGH